jgi:hypothetical protein
MKGPGMRVTAYRASRAPYTLWASLGGRSATACHTVPSVKAAQSRNSGTIQNGFWPRATRSKLSKALRQRFQ